MQQFNLEEWLNDKSRKIVTRGGRMVEILKVDAKGNHPIIGVYQFSDTEDMESSWRIDGRKTENGESSFDLFFADEEDELTDFEKAVERILPYRIPIYMLKSASQQLLELARKEIEKSSWSEEDEKMWSQVINEIEAIKSNSSTIFEKNIAQDKIDWLNSIKDRVQPQQKQEWSEDDERHRKRIIERLEDIRKSKEDNIDIASVILSEINWFKSLKPHWKPSEEQMNALDKAKNNPSNYYDIRLGLQSLYNDLKKLKS